MNVAVVTSSPLFAEGGHLVLARSIVSALRDAGHHAELVVTPQNRFGRQASAYMACWLTDVGMTHDGSRVDHVISLRYPAYAVRHPSHVCWLNHRMREYYDLWDDFNRQLSWKSRLKERARRRVLHAVDRYLLTRHVRKLFVQSATVQRRLERWGSLPSEVLYPPPPPRQYRCDEYGDWFFAVSRLTPLKRMDLLIRALAEPEAVNVRCVIAGDGPEASRLRQLAADLGVNDRVRLVGAIDTASLLDYLARCRAVVFPVLNEDYGLVTVEAFASRKAVVTCADSGGPAELVRHAVSGLVCESTPSALAGAMARLAADATLAERMGGEAALAAAQLTWPKTIDKLLLR